MFTVVGICELGFMELMYHAFIEKKIKKKQIKRMKKEYVLKYVYEGMIVLYYMD